MVFAVLSASKVCKVDDCVILFLDNANSHEIADTIVAVTAGTAVGSTATVPQIDVTAAEAIVPQFTLAAVEIVTSPVAAVMLKSAKLVGNV